jgi:hypothetical protein
VDRAGSYVDFGTMVSEMAVTEGWREQHGDRPTPAGTKINGFRLNAWLGRQRKALREGTLPHAMQDALAACGVGALPE